MSIVKKLNKLGKVVMASYPYINHGGCCVYAAMIVSALHKHKIKAEGIVASWSALGMNRAGQSIDTVREAVKKNKICEWQDNGISFSHVGVEFEVDGKKYHYDSKGAKRAKREFDGMPIYKGRLKLQEMRGLAGRKEGWNDTFDRKDIPALRQLVKEHLLVDKA